MAYRWYQQEAHVCVIQHVRGSVEPCLVEATTGAGKSHIVAGVAAELHRLSGGKHVLCLAPSSELVTQNREKYKATGNPSSIYSASAGSKCLRHPVVFATPGTFKKVAKRMGAKFCAVIMDEAHGITPTVRGIIDDMRESNPNLRVIGLTATPYRLGSGYIYRMDDKGRAMTDHNARDPYFAKLVYRIQAHTLIAEGFLTKPKIGEVAEHYDTSGLHLNARGQFDAADIDRAFMGHGRLTSAIVGDVVRRSQNRRGVMFFAASIEHAQEVMASLPPSLSALVTGETSKADRADILKRFKAQKIKYLVNVSVLTTGFDAPHVDVVAILRKTESVGLLQQIIGRGLRICDGKEDCLILDYAENIADHCPDGDIFAPEITAAYKSGESVPLEVCCPDCMTVQEFTARPNDEGYAISKEGYFLDLEGEPIQTDAGPMPAHYGRRCFGIDRHGTRCGYRWTLKRCPVCAEDNDIAARRCHSCKAELIDPNERLRLDFAALKKDPTRLQVDEVLDWKVNSTMTRAGKEAITVDYVTPYRQFRVWLAPYAKGGQPLADYRQWYEATDGGTVKPETITYRKDPESGFYRVHGYWEEKDEIQQ
jgi:DNA repair protein RadD